MPSKSAAPSALEWARPESAPAEPSPWVTGPQALPVLAAEPLSAAQFLLKTRHGYRETEPEDARNSVRIIFNLPAAAPDLKTYVEHATLLGVGAKPRKPAVIDHE